MHVCQCCYDYQVFAMHAVIVQYITYGPSISWCVLMQINLKCCTAFFSTKQLYTEMLSVDNMLIQVVCTI